MNRIPRVQWPDGKRFAFTVFDDTDHSTVENVKPIYDELAELGFRTTKSVWPLRPERGAPEPIIGGSTCEDQHYRDWVLDLQSQGFEIALHNVSPSTSHREHTIRGLAEFERIFGHSPYTLANHAGNREAIYFGPARLSGMRRRVYQAMTRGRRDVFRGHVQGSDLFWGDVCREKVQYVRNFVFNDIDTLAACPEMPYRDPSRPYVKHWFASSEGPNVQAYNQLLRAENQDRLEARGGACIVYTHFASGFFAGGRLDPNFRRLMRRLSEKNGWFVPVHVLLDYLRNRGPAPFSVLSRLRLEWHWLAHKIRVGGTT